jgi:MinD-like ATPase involved in chromosome partitioning or flagellar assembly
MERTVVDEPRAFVDVVPVDHAAWEQTPLVDYKPGSKLDLRLTEIERTLHEILALLIVARG